MIDYITKEKLAYLAVDSFDFLKSLKKHRIMSIFNNVGDIFDLFKEHYVELVNIITQDEFEKMDALISNRENLKIFFSECKRLDCDFVTYCDDDYPEKLRDLSEPPFVIYYRGNLKLLSGDLILMAGTRFATNYGMDCARKFTSSFVENELYLLSGISDGIDTAIVEKVLEESGVSVIVAAGGIDSITPVINSDLAKEVETNGLVMSEFRPNITAQKYHYVLRNRLLSCLCDVAILIEADVESNSIGVIDMAYDFGKEIYAVCGNINNKYSQAPNFLILNQKANILIEPQQIMEIFRDQFYFAPKSVLMLDETETKICEVLEKKPCHIDEIAEKLELSSGILIGRLLVLETKGKIRKLPANFYEII
ncbi:MAG: DNA-processing protein DprA [Clostridia bacterium]